MDERIEEIRNRLITARSLGDTEGIVRGLYDLEDIGWNEVCMVARTIGINGERLEIWTWLRGGMRIIAPGTTLAFKLIWALRCVDMITKHHHRWIKHKNDMSPEEYEWAYP